MPKIIALEASPRNRVLLTLLYASGGRVSEVCALKWKDAQDRTDGGQVTLFGKGGKTRGGIALAIHLEGAPVNTRGGSGRFSGVRDRA